MGGLPADFDASFLNGLQLESIVFHQYIMHLNFSNDITISIESAFSYSKNKQKTKPIRIPPDEKTDVMMLVGKRIVGAAGGPGGTLRLVFENGHEFICHVNSGEPKYDSYAISRGKDETIVVV